MVYDTTGMVRDHNGQCEYDFYENITMVFLKVYLWSFVLYCPQQLLTPHPSASSSCCVTVDILAPPLELQLCEQKQTSPFSLITRLTKLRTLSVLKTWKRRYSTSYSMATRLRPAASEVKGNPNLQEIVYQLLILPFPSD